MRKLALAGVVTAAMIGAGFFAWQAEATTPSAAVTLGATAKNYSPVKEIACRGWGRHCPPGFIWRCGPARCWCRPC
jgi:hypothetical protein